MKITIIIPTYNEGEVIGSLLDAVLIETNSITKHSFSILIVDSKSKDNTEQVVRQKMSSNKNLYLLVEEVKKGLGSAYINGMNYAINNLGAEAFMEFDGDFQHNPKDIKKLVEKLDAGYEYIIGSRYVNGGTIPKEWPWYRKFISSIGNMVIRSVLNLDIKDGTSGFKLTKVAPLKDKMPLKTDQLISIRHAYKIQFLYNLVKEGAKTVEVPIDFLDRKKGFSKSTLEDIVESLKVVCTLFKNKKRINKEATYSK